MITQRSGSTYRRRRSSSVRRTARRSAARWPSWRELAGRHARKTADGTTGAHFSMRRLTLWVLLIAGLIIARVWHVHATRAALEEVQWLRREHLQLVLQYNRLRGELDRATSPAVIYQRARALGLEEGFTYGPIVIREQR